MATRKVFVRGIAPAPTSKGGKKAPIIRPASRKGKRPGKASNGEAYTSGVPTADEIERNPTLLSGTGRGNPGCGGLVVNERRRPTYVVVSKGENGQVRATVRGVEITGILRAIGKAGYKWQTAATWLTQMAIPLARNTIVSQVSAGKGYDPKRWGEKETLRGPIPQVDTATMMEVKRVSRTDPQFKFENE